MAEFFTFLLVIPFLLAILFVGGIALFLVIGVMLYPFVWLAQVLGIIHTPENK